MSGLNDIAVLGSGPAALSIAAACTERGASVTLVAPEPEAPWQPNYCLWADEVSPRMEHLTERLWPQASVVTALGSRVLERPYVKLDTQELQRFLWGALRAGSVRITSSRAAALDHRGTESRIRTDDGTILRARVVIDASGARSPFIKRTHRRAPAFQTAFGLMLRAPGHGFDPNRMVLMDFCPASRQDPDPPSFLYVLPMGDDRLFIEETSLARRPAMRLSVLRARLEARLASLGLQHCERIDEEHCSIAMGLGLPTPEQALVPFGAAAAMVHPASGYLVSRVLRKADPVAASIVESLVSGDASLAIASGNATLWPRQERAVWELYTFGLETLVGMTATEIGCFFDSFFRLPQNGWSGFLGGTLSRSELAAVMTRLFGTLPASVRWHLVRTGLSAGAAPLARSVLQPGLT
ncbi:MAG: lycopene cyclase family protein [Myxococcales bacterium]|nr:lycopene cyclase family protein [Myxococcales bacterium]MDH3483012.1 lycopene cyclase family protein [Myxococcales bacterium]